MEADRRSMAVAHRAPARGAIGRDLPLCATTSSPRLGHAGCRHAASGRARLRRQCKLPTARDTRAAVVR
jgi:hypothetical protein